MNEQEARKLLADAEPHFDKYYLHLVCRSQMAYRHDEATLVYALASRCVDVAKLAVRLADEVETLRAELGRNDRGGR